MATTGRIMGMLAAEARRKRSRTEIEGGEETSSMPELPIEVQLAIVERAELGQRGAVPVRSERLVEVSEIWARVYGAWKEGRAMRMEHIPKMISLDTARLFVSPRFKFVTEMRGSIAQEILKVYADVMESEQPEKPSFSVLMLYRADPVDWEDEWGWHVAFLTGIRKNEKGLIVFESYETKFGGGIGEGAAIGFLDTKTVWAGHDAKPMIVSWEWGEDDEDPEDAIHVSDVLIYGQTSYYPMVTAMRRDEVLQRLEMVGYLFWIDAVRFDRPSPGMLAMRDKIIVVRAAARPGHIRGGQGNYHALSSGVDVLRVDVFFYRDETPTATDRMIAVEVPLTNMPRIKEVVTVALEDARKVLAAENVGGFGLLMALSSHRIRQEAVWPNGARVELSEWKVGEEEVFAIPENDFALEAVQSRVAAMPEPALKSFTDNPEWGYEQKMWIQSMSEGKMHSTDVKGVLIMPAPWFFYLATKKGNGGTRFLTDGEVRFEGHFGLAEVGFWFRPWTAMLLTNNSSHIYAHQTHDLVFLPDTVDNIFVEELTLLQRRDIEERATASLVEEIEDGVELL